MTTTKYEIQSKGELKAVPLDEVSLGSSFLYTGRLHTRIVCDTVRQSNVLTFDHVTRREVYLANQTFVVPVHVTVTYSPAEE